MSLMPEKFVTYWNREAKPAIAVCTPAYKDLKTLPDLPEAEQREMLKGMEKYRDLPGQVYIGSMAEIVDEGIKQDIISFELLDSMFTVQATLNSQEYWDAAFGDGNDNTEEAEGRKKMRGIMNELVGLLE